MSADNGIFIGRFPTSDPYEDKDTFEYRVIEASAIENCDDDPSFHTRDPNGELAEHYRVLYYKSKYAKVFLDHDEAWKYAQEFSKEFHILEYGVKEIQYDKPLLDKTYEEADTWEKAWWAARALRQMEAEEAGFDSPQDHEQGKLFVRVKAEFKDEDLDDLVHDAKSQEASDINNGGLEDQFNYLAKFYGLKELEKMLFTKDRIR